MKAWFRASSKFRSFLLADSRPDGWSGTETGTPRRPGEDAEPRAPGQDGQIRLLIQFMSQIGVAMNGAGEATTFIRRSLQRIGNAYGMRNLDVFVVPTLLLLRYGDDHSTFVDLSSRVPADLRLDQVSDLYWLVRDAEAGRIGPLDGMQRLRVILARPPRYGVALRVLALALVALGLTLILEPSPSEVLVAMALALVVGVIKEAGARWPPVWPLVPAAAGLVAGAVAFLVVEGGVDARPERILIPPLTIFLPGAALTVSMIELSNGDVIAGGSRLAYGIARLFLLIFGVVVAAEWVGLPAQASPPDVIPWVRVAQLLGLALFTAGVYVHFSSPKGSLGWLLLVVAAAWAGQQVGSFVLSAELGGFVGGAVMIVVARMVTLRAGAPPLIVSYAPAFWLLVPGAIGLEGLAQIVQGAPQTGVTSLLGMVTAMVSIALGVLFGLALSGSARMREH